MPFVYLLAHAPGDVEQLVLLGQRVFIQTWAGSKKIRGQIPDHAGQWVLPGGAHGKDQDPAKALRAIVLAETGMRLDDPVARTNYDIGEPKLHRLEDRDYNPFTVIEYPFSASGLRRFADAIDGNIQKLSMQDCLFAKTGIPRRTEALEKLGPVLPPQSGWQTFIVKNFYGGTPPGPFNTEVDTLTTQITVSTKQSGAWFEEAIEVLIPESSSHSPSPPPPPPPKPPFPPEPPPPPVDPVPEIVGIQIVGAPSRLVAGADHTVDFQAGAQAALRAVLNPDDPAFYANLTWSTGQAGTRDIAVDRHPVGAVGAFANYTVNLIVNGVTVSARSIGVGVVPVVQSLAYESFAFRDHVNAWYSYVLSNQFGLPNQFPAQAIATTAPNTAGDWQHIAWQNDSAAGPAGNRRLVYLDAAGPVNLQVRSDSAAPLTTPLAIRNVRQWPAGTPRIALRQITFTGGRSVFQEDALYYGHAYGRVWRPGQTVPQTYTRNTNVGLQPEFQVNTAGDGTSTDVRASLFLPLADGSFHRMVWNWANIASANGATATLTPAAVNADVTLPNQVVCGDPARILWEMRANGGNDGDWTLFDVSSHELYVTYADAVAGYGLPNGGRCLYWTVLKLSCEAANGEAGTPADLKAAIYSIVGNTGAFDPATGNNPAVRRARDGTVMTYWSRPQQTSQYLKDMLSDPRYFDAVQQEYKVSCACGCWADLLVAMFAAHGESTPRVVDVRGNLAESADVYRFMVSNWTFHAPPAGDPADYSHDYGAPGTNVAGTATWGPGMPGQNNPAPTNRFVNHLIVYDTAGGLTFYDPSYGSPTVNTTGAYVTAAASGLEQAGNPPFGFSIAAGAPDTILKLRIENGADLN